MTQDWTPIIRVLLRYGAGALVSKGALDFDTANMLMSDPALISLITGLVVGGVSEIWYYTAKKTGKAT